MFLPDTEVWRHKPFRKSINAPISLVVLLEELSWAGKIPIQFDKEA